MILYVLAPLVLPVFFTAVLVGSHNRQAPTEQLTRARRCGAPRRRSAKRGEREFGTHPRATVADARGSGLSVRKRRLPDVHAAKPRGAPDFHR
jgi:hypothetical protein